MADELNPQAEYDLAVSQLQALVKIPGALKIITAEVQPSLRVDPNDPRSKAKDDTDLTRHQSFVCWDVERLEGPNDRGQYIAYSDTGNCWTLGQPQALLKRLTEATR